MIDRDKETPEEPNWPSHPSERPYQNKPDPYFEDPYYPDPYQ
jgi:hypothetical protein